MMFIATLYLQQVLGYSALGTGVAFVPLALSACAGGPLARQVRRRFDGASGTRIGWPARHPPFPRISRGCPVEDRRL
jgi:hypothetical protein